MTPRRPKLSNEVFESYMSYIEIINYVFVEIILFRVKGQCH